MDAHHRDKASHRTRFNPEGVTPLEIWDLEVDGLSLFAAKGRADYVTRLAHATLQLVRSDLRCRQVERIVLCGGGALDPDLDAAFSALPLPVERRRDGAFFGAIGGEAHHARAARFGLTFDAGQTALKLAWPNGRLKIARPAQAPLSTRDSLSRFFSSALAQARILAGRDFDALLWALPSQIDASLSLAGSSYPGMRGDRALIDDTLAAADFDAIPTELLNDAELAALSTRALFPDAPRTLVLTLGFGVGAAIVDALPHA